MEPDKNQPDSIGPGDIDGFVRERLENPDREEPLVVISVARGSHDYLVSPTQVAEQMGDLAQVVRLEDEDAGWELSRRVGGRLSCYWGAVRLYWPGFDSGTSRAYEHPVWLSQRIRAAGPKDVIDEIAEIISERASEAVVPRIDEVEAALQEERRQREAAEERLADLRDQIAGVERDHKELSARVDGAEDENASLRDQIAQLERSQRNIALDPESIYRFFAQKKAPFSLVSGDEPSGDLADIYWEIVKTLGEKHDEAVSDRDTARDESATAQDALEEERAHRLAAEHQRDEALEGQARLREERKQADHLREKAEERLRDAEQDRSELKARVQGLESGVEFKRLQDEIIKLKESHTAKQLQWETERDKFKLKFDDYEAQIEQFSKILSVSNQTPVAVSLEEEEEPQIESVADAVLAASRLDNLEFLDNAWDTAKRSQSKKGPDLYRVLCELDRLAVEYRGGLGKGVKEWLHEQLPDVPFEYAPFLSDTTASKREQTYTFGETFMPKHLKFGGGHNTQNLLRVHFEYEFEEGPPRCEIGHVGEHLPNEMS